MAHRLILNNVDKYYEDNGKIVYDFVVIKQMFTKLGLRDLKHLDFNNVDEDTYNKIKILVEEF